MYLVLPSNSSCDLYPENKISNFTIHLPASVDLVGQHEIALAEILYSNSWFDVDQKNIVGQHEIALAEILYSNSWFDVDQKNTA